MKGKLKIALINPPHLYLKQPRSQMPIGVLYLAAVLKDYNVSVLDFSDIHPSKIKLPEADVYGITGTIVDIDSINTLIKIIQAESIGKILVGGPCAITPDAIIGADSIIKGEAELIIDDIIKDIEQDNLKPFYTGITVNNLDFLPLPARHLLDYIGGDIFLGSKGASSTVIISSRGCPFSCAFCASPGIWGGVRLRSAQSVYDEVKSIIDIYGIRQFKFSDDSLTTNRKRMFELCNLLSTLDVSWRASIRTSPNNIEIFKAMVDGGCKEVSFGVESFDQYQLDYLNKRAKVEDSSKAIINAKAAGLGVRCLMMAALPGQRQETMKINKTKILELLPELDSVVCKNFVPLPGSDIWINPSNYDVKILQGSYSDFNFHLFDPDGRRKPPKLVTFLHRPDEDILQESEDFQDFLIEIGIANEG